MYHVIVAAGANGTSVSQLPGPCCLFTFLYHQSFKGIIYVSGREGRMNHVTEQCREGKGFFAPSLESVVADELWESRAEELLSEGSREVGLSRLGV